MQDYISISLLPSQELQHRTAISTAIAYVAREAIAIPNNPPNTPPAMTAASVMKIESIHRYIMYT